jgi:hypothetical protein
VLFAATDGVSARNNVGTATTTSKAANASRSRILLYGIEFAALAANVMIICAVSETARLTRQPLIELYSKPYVTRASLETTV